MARITVRDSRPDDPIFKEGPQSFFPRLARGSPQVSGAAAPPRQLPFHCALKAPDEPPPPYI